MYVQRKTKNKIKRIHNNKRKEERKEEKKHRNNKRKEQEITQMKRKNKKAKKNVKILLGEMPSKTQEYHYKGRSSVS